MCIIIIVYNNYYLKSITTFSHYCAFVKLFCQEISSTFEESNGMCYIAITNLLKHNARDLL